MKPASVLVDLLLRHVGERYTLGIRVPKHDPAWRGPWDCAEIVTWGAYQITGELFGVGAGQDDPAVADAYSGHWADLAARSPEQCVALGVGLATPGVVLIRAPQARGMSGHVALSTGDGRTVEAYDTAHGVIASRSTGRRWDAAYLVPGLAYSLRAPIEQPQPVILRIGDSGPDVLALQGALRRAGYPAGTIDGRYGERTARAVAEFQRSRHLVPDGEAGPLTRAALRVVGAL